MMDVADSKVVVDIAVVLVTVIEDHKNNIAMVDDFDTESREL